MSNTITAIFETRRDLETALRRLEKINVTDKQVGVIMGDDTHGKFFRLETHSKSAEGIVSGATFGGVMGGILTALAGAGTLAIPGLNLVAVGPIVTGLAGAAVGAAAGGLVGGFVGLGIPEHEAKLYEEKLKSGYILLAVEARDGQEATQIRDILEKTRAHNIAA